MARLSFSISAPQPKIPISADERVKLEGAELPTRASTYGASAGLRHWDGISWMMLRYPDRSASFTGTMAYQIGENRYESWYDGQLPGAQVRLR